MFLAPTYFLFLSCISLLLKFDSAKHLLQEKKKQNPIQNRVTLSLKRPLGSYTFSNIPLAKFYLPIE
jgi:hypothetical protein